MIDASVLKEISDHYFGWHTHQFSRWWEYPWVIRQLELSADLKILDAGAGKSPLPFFLAEKGAITYTVDNGSADESAEWGYVDYSASNHKIVSYNMNFRSLPWAKDDYFDAMISVSVMEHLPAHERREALREFNRILKDNGRLILTIDVQKDGIKLWNRCRGIRIEADEDHGTVESLIEELKNYGFTVFMFEECPVKNDETLVMGLALIKTSRLSGTYVTEELETGKGHMRQKYTNDYFLGTNDSQHFAVYGWEEFQKGKTNDRVKSEFEFLLQVAGSLQDKDVLEIGFGRGDFIPLFLNAGIRTYVGVDFSPSAIRIASDNFKDPRLNLFQMNATDLSVDKKFDIVAFFDIIEHIPPYDMEIVWSKIKQILKPGGYIAISTPVFENPNSADHSDLIEEVSGMHCNKQTIGTLFFSSLKNGFTIAKHNDRTFVLVQSNDLNLLPEEVRDTYVQNQSSLLNRFGLRNVDQNEPNQLTRKLVPGAGRIALGCVTENQPKYLSQSLRLLQSIRWFGGGMSGVNFFVCFVDEIDSEYAREFERLGAFIRKVRRFSKDHPHSNKLSFFDLPEIAAYDTIMLLDCDTLVVQDALPFLDGRCLQAKIADLPTIPHDTFAHLFEYFDLRFPPEEFHCTSDGSPTIWYCNTGVLVFPSELVKSFVPIWRDYNLKLSKRLGLLEPNQNYCDQASFSLAFAAHSVPFKELPVSMNFPLHLTNMKTPTDMMECDPVILHYHDKFDASGYLLPSPYPGAQRRIQLFNDRLRESRKVHFDNRLFWDFRYSNFPELGSGIGSRGESLDYKRELLKRIINGLEPSSILDIGCGDCEAASEVPDNLYTGVDISKVVINNNISKMPTRTFIHGDFLTLDLEPADLILCFDVLIHLSNPKVYQAFVQKLVSCSLKYGIISGYEERPSDGVGMCFFHEPLSYTLKRFGARAIRKVGQYRNVAVYSFIKSPSEVLYIEDFETDLTPVCITGMHRSGTSMVARLLNLCGLYLGEEKDIIGPEPDNPEGFWENVHFLNLNNEILSKLGGAWDLPPNFDKGWERQPKFKPLTKKAALLIRRFEQYSFWGWKDPRSSLTAPFWNMLLKNLKFIVCVRHPLEVAESLRKRGYNSNAFSLNLWNIYNRQLLSCTKERQRIVTHYDSYFTDPGGELRRIFDFLNIKISDEAINQACATINNSLRHHRIQTAAERLPSKTMKLCKKLCMNAGQVYKESEFCKASGIEYSETKQSVRKIISKSQDVHVGNEGWLFLEGGTNRALDYYKNPDLFNDALVAQWSNLLKRRIEYFSQKGIEYIHLFVPDKLTIYPEHFGEPLEYLNGGPLRKFNKEIEKLTENSILDHIVNPTYYFNERKRDLQLYWKTDTHWTFYGVYCAYQLICSKLGIEPNKELVNRPKINGQLAMDLGSKLNPPLREDVAFFKLVKDSKRIYANDIVEYKEKNNLENCEGLHVGSHVIFRNKYAPHLKRVLLFGDSYSEYRPHLLTGALVETFYEVAFVWATSLDMSYIEQYNPDIVITEIAERFMPTVPADDFSLEAYVYTKLKTMTFPDVTKKSTATQQDKE